MSPTEKISAPRPAVETIATSTVARSGENAAETTSASSIPNSDAVEIGRRPASSESGVHNPLGVIIDDAAARRIADLLADD